MARQALAFTKESLPASIPEKLVWDATAQDALARMEAGASVFLTGRAGTGKSTLLKHFRATTKRNIAVVAPTGVAAVNVQGQTIHSFFGFSLGMTTAGVRRRAASVRKLFEHLQTLVVDEVSMVRADLLDCMDRFLRLNGPDAGRPFGGVQMIFVGDLYQLPPVVPKDEEAIFQDHYESPYFFHAFSYKELEMVRVDLTTVHRQNDADFIALLDAVRMGNITDDQIKALNTRVVDYLPEELPEGCVLLTTRNDMAHRYNADQLARLEGRPFTFPGSVEGDFPEKALPTAKDITLKVGAQVMLLNNDPMKKWVNGDVGRITRITGEDQEWMITVHLANGTTVDVKPFTWQKHRYVFNKEEGRIDTEVVGAFSQLPVRLAWAVTIHKGQGKTFDKVVVDFGHGTFAPGQAYVALSRCRTMDGLSLCRPLERRHLMVDPRLKGC